MNTHILEYPVTVCDACLRASCFQSVLLCDRVMTAGVKEMTVGELRELGRESPEYWFKSPGGVIDQQALTEFRSCP